MTVFKKYGWILVDLRVASFKAPERRIVLFKRGPFTGSKYNPMYLDTNISKMMETIVRKVLSEQPNGHHQICK